MRQVVAVVAAHSINAFLNYRVFERYFAFTIFERMTHVQSSQAVAALAWDVACKE